MRAKIGAADATVMAADASKATMLAALRAAETDLHTTFALVGGDEVGARPRTGIPRRTLNELFLPDALFGIEVDRAGVEINR